MTHVMKRGFQVGVLRHVRSRLSLRSVSRRSADAQMASSVARS